MEENTTPAPFDGSELARAVRMLGGLTATAQRLVDAGLVPGGRMTPQNIHNWIMRGYCPPRYAPWIERETGILREYLISDELAILLEGACDDVDAPEAR